MAHWRTCNSYNEIWPKERVPNDVWQSEKRRPSQGLQASQIAEIMKSDQAAQFTKYVYLREVTEQIKKGQSPNRLMLKEPFILRPALQPLSLRPMTTCTQDLSSTCLGWWTLGSFGNYTVPIIWQTVNCQTR